MIDNGARDELDYIFLILPFSTLSVNDNTTIVHSIYTLTHLIRTYVCVCV